MNIEITLKLSKSTKGTHVYEMAQDGRGMGSVYLPKLLLPAEPPAELSMTIGPKKG